VNEGARGDRRFARLWTAATISYVGDGVLLVAFPLLAATLTDSPLAIAGAQVALWLPWLITGLLGGVVADRLDRRRIMLFVDSARAGLVALLAAAVLGSWMSIPLLYAVAFGLGLGETFFAPAGQSLLPNIVTEDRLERASGQLYASESVAKELVGSAIGGALFALAMWAPFLIDAVSFLMAAVIVGGLVGSYRAVGSTDAVAQGTIRSEIRQGWNFVRRHRLLLALMSFGVLLNIGSGAVEATLVVFAQRVLHLSDFGFGMLLATAAVGGSAASLVTDRVTSRFGPGTVMIAGPLFAGVAMCAAAFTNNGIVFAVLFAVVFAANAFANIISFTVRQQLTPDELRGRVSGVFRTIIVGAIPVGALVGGLVAEHVSIRGPVLMFGILSLVVAFAASIWTNNATVATARAAIANDAGG
jgi:MFS family permease